MIAINVKFNWSKAKVTVTLNDMTVLGIAVIQTSCLTSFMS